MMEEGQEDRQRSGWKLVLAMGGRWRAGSAVRFKSVEYEPMRQRNHNLGGAEGRAAYSDFMAEP